MNKWEDQYKTTNIEKKICVCNSSYGLFIPNRHLSLLIAGLLFLFFTIFMSGYFLGKKFMVKTFTQKIQEESFGDKIYATTLAMGDVNNEQTILSSEENKKKSELVSTLNIVKEPDTIEKEEQLKDEKLYYAQLCGFSTEKAAQKFADKLLSKNISVEVKKRMSKTAKGRVSYWYQVVTAPYNNKNDLSLLTDRLIREEKLKDVSIRTC